MRRAYGVRLRMLHERTAIWGEADKLDPEAFCLLGISSKRVKGKFYDPQKSVVNILAFKISRGLSIEDALVEAERLIYGPDGKPDGED